MSIKNTIKKSLKTRTSYEHFIGGMSFDTREAARITQRSLRQQGVPKDESLIQQIKITTKVVR